MEFAVAILAGGKSKRFAEDKLIYPYKGNPIISYPIRESYKITNSVYIVTNEDEYNKLKNLFNTNFLIDDYELKCKGSARGIATAVKYIDSDYLIIIPGDVPWINHVAIRNLIEFSMRTQLLVSPIIYSGIVSPLFMALPKKYASKIISLCNDYSLISSRPSNYIRGNESLLIGSYHLTDSSREFYDVDTKIDMVNIKDKGLPRKILHLNTANEFINGINKFRDGKIEESFNSFINESKIYRKNKLYSLELSTLIDALFVSKKHINKIEKRINWLRMKIGRSPKES